MKKRTIFLTLLLILALTACSPSTTANVLGEAAPSQSVTLSPEETLLLGSFNIEGTDQAITADQAFELLPLWQVYNELLTRDNAAQAEFDALIVQIQETMTASQLSTIEAMSLTQQDVFAIMQEQNIGMAQSSSSSNSSSVSAQSGIGMAPPDGGGDMGGGAPPDSGAMPMGDMGGGFSAGSSQSDTTTISVSNGPIAMLIKALIQLLQSKIVT